MAEASIHAFAMANPVYFTVIVVAVIAAWATVLIRFFS